LTDTSRLETFCDGVFAIAITLLVLGIRVPDPSENLGAALVHEWPTFLAYLISFVTIGIMWVNHHRLFALIERSNPTFAYINVGFLLFVAFVPYPTELMATQLAGGSEAGKTLAMILYGGTFVAIAILFNAIWLYAASGARLLRPGLDLEALKMGGRRFSIGPPAYLIITLLAVVNPYISLALVGLLAVYWMLPGSAPDPAPRS
jgi:uncharacterized membrane protein